MPTKSEDEEKVNELRKNIFAIISEVKASTLSPNKLQSALRLEREIRAEYESGEPAAIQFKKMVGTLERHFKNAVNEYNPNRFNIFKKANYIDELNRRGGNNTYYGRIGLLLKDLQTKYMGEMLFDPQAMDVDRSAQRKVSFRPK